MLTKTEIAKHTNTKSFDRGRIMAKTPDNITQRRIVRLEDVVEVHAKVVSASGWSEHFSSCIITDDSLTRIIDYECTCPAHLRFDSMCKHCVALALTFATEPKTFEGYGEQRVAKTSRSLMSLLNSSAQIFTTDSRISGVSLAVELTHEFGRWTARFRIGSGATSYVLPSPRDFARALHDHAFVSYGKKLAFTHTLDAFDDPSQTIALIILHAVELRETIDSSVLATIPHIRGGRDLPLSEFEVVELLDAIGNRDFSFIDKERGRHLYNMHVTDGDPDLALRILPDEREGFQIMRDEEITVAASGNSMYVFMDDMAYRCSSKLAKAAPFLEQVYLSVDDELFLASKDAPQFCASILSSLEEALDVHMPSELEAMRPQKCVISYYFDLLRVDKKEIITVEVHATYGEREFIIPDGVEVDAMPFASGMESAAPIRDEVRERKAIDDLLGFFDMSFRLPLDDEDSVGSLLYGGLDALGATGEVFTTSAFDKLLVTRPPRMQIGLSIDGNLLNMDVQSTDIDHDELVALLKSYKRKKHFHRLKGGAFLSLSDMEMRQFARMVEDLGLTPDQLAKGNINLPAYRAFLLDREYSEVFRDESFSSYIDCFNEVDQSAFKLPLGLEGTLRPYQEEGFRWLSTLTQLGFGGILADEMGLGKTVQIIALLLAEYEKGCLDKPALIVCPASLVYNWAEEFSRFAPQIKASPIEGTKTERNAIRRSTDANVLIVSYDIARIDLEKFEAMEFSFIILDEAQYIKNHATKTTRAIKRLNGEHRFALTGTPIENRLSEIWSIFDFLMPGFLGSYAYFMQRYEIGIIGGDAEAAERLQALVGPFVLRRLKETVLVELPEKMESSIHVPLTSEQKRLYDANEQDLRESLNIQKRKNSSREHKRGQDFAKRLGEQKIEVLAELTRLRQIALDPSLIYENYHGNAAKKDIIIELVDQAIESGQKALVFSQFTSYLSILKDELSKRMIDFYEITGATPKQERIDLVNAFNTDNVPVFLVSLKAGGTGLNLTGASVVIHADPWWNAAAIDQATDRAHRIGQQRSVNVYKIIAKDTIEERIEALQEKKSRLADTIIKEVDSLSLANLTRDDLRYLLSE